MGLAQLIAQKIHLLLALKLPNLLLLAQGIMLTLNLVKQQVSLRPFELLVAFDIVQEPLPLIDLLPGLWIVIRRLLFSLQFLLKFLQLLIGFKILYLPPSAPFLQLVAIPLLDLPVASLINLVGGWPDSGGQDPAKQRYENRSDNFI